jgi:iron complex outermembrane receptor protein
MSARTAKRFLNAGVSLGVLACMTTMAGAPVASAQDPNKAGPEVGTNSNSVEEIVVTSRRREEKLQDVPLAVSAFTAQSLDQLQITDATQLSDFTPGFQYTNYTNGREDRGDFHTQEFRGLNLGNNFSLYSASLSFLDGAPVISSDIPITDSLERIEVLKGPQNVYFGRSVMTGAINYVTRAPGEQYQGSISAEVGNFSEYRFQAHLEGPLVLGKLTGGLDGYIASNGGHYANAAPSPNEPLGAQDTKSVSATLYATPSDNFSSRLYATYFKYDDGLGQSVTLPGASGYGEAGFGGHIPTGYTSTCNPGGPSGRDPNTGALLANFYPCGAFGTIPSNLIASSAVLTKNELYVLSNPPNYPQLIGKGYCDHFGVCSDNIGTHLITDYDLDDGIKISNITAYHRKDVADLDPADGQDSQQYPNPLYGNPKYPLAPSFELFDYNIQTRTEDYSTELRATSPQDQPFRWTFGANYVHAAETTELYFYTPTGSLPFFGADQRFGVVYADSEGVFGEIDYEPIEGLIFSAGLRWQDDTLTSLGSNTLSPEFKHSYYSRSPRGSVSYKIDSDLTVYGSWALGVRPGGFNTALISLPEPLIQQIVAQTGNAAVAYKQEKLYTYEVGVKGGFFDNAIRTNLSAYRGKLADQQTDSTALTTYDIEKYGGRFDIIANTGEVNIWGIEGDAHWKALPILDLSATAAWNHTQVVGSSCYACYLVTGNYHVDDGKAMPGAPQYTFSIAADFRDHLFDTWDWFAHGDLAYKGKQFIDQENLSWIPAFINVGFQAGIENETWSIGAFVKNATDYKGLIGAQISSDENSGSNNAIRGGLSDPREYGVRAKYKFGPFSLDDTPAPAAYVPPPVQAPMKTPSVAHSYMVFFDFNKSDLTAQAISIVDQAAANAGPAKATELVVTGHTDTVGSYAYNMRLSRRRAESVAAELEKKGIASSEIEIVAKGKTDLLVPTKDGVREPQNRRVTIVYEGGATS